MAMSGAERQRRYRERHHDIAHLTIDVHVDVRDRLDRLSIHYDRCLTELVESWRLPPRCTSRRACRAQALPQYPCWQ